MISKDSYYQKTRSIQMWRTGTLIHYCWETVIWKKMMAPQKLSRITIWSSNSTSGYIFKKIKESSQVKKKKEKAEESEIKLSTSTGSQKKQENSRKTTTFALLNTLKPLTVWITTNCGKFLKRWKWDHLTCLLRNLYTGKVETARTGYGITDWFKIEKRAHQGCIIVTLLI